MTLWTLFVERPRHRGSETPKAKRSSHNNNTTNNIANQNKCTATMTLINCNKQMRSPIRMCGYVVLCAVTLSLFHDLTLGKTFFFYSISDNDHCSSPSLSEQRKNETTSLSSATASNALLVNVNHDKMVRLLSYLRQKKTDYKSAKWGSAKFMLEFLVEQAPTMFPLLGTVPVSANETMKQAILSSPVQYMGMEEEDRLIYEHFFNEKTRQCHAFGPAGLFESGAYTGVAKSNTDFFEKYFQIPATLVEADKGNWPQLEKSVAAHRPLSTVYHEALCPVGDTQVCLNANTEHGAKSSVTRDSCEDAVPCFKYDDSKHYAFMSLDIEGFEWEFVKFRNIKADILLVEVIQWVRQEERTLTAVEFISYMASLGYYLYASPDHMIGVRNFVFLSRDLVHNCFKEYII